MQLTKNGEVITLENDAHIRAFLQTGWTEYKQEEIKRDTIKKKIKKAN